MTSIASTDTSPGRPFLGGPLRTAILAVAVLAVVALAATGWFGVAWYRAAHGKSLTVGVARDAVLGDAQQSTTGSLFSQLHANRDAYARAITASAAVTSARVLDAAVASLNASAGTAEVLVGVDVTSQADQGDPSCAHRRVRLDMIRAGNTWKVGTLTPVGDAYSDPGPCTPGTSPR
jgi:Mce-associated membrane protein